MNNFTLARAAVLALTAFAGFRFQQVFGDERLAQPESVPVSPGYPRGGTLKEFHAWLWADASRREQVILAERLKANEDSRRARGEPPSGPICVSGGISAWTENQLAPEDWAILRERCIDELTRDKGPRRDAIEFARDLQMLCVVGQPVPGLLRGMNEALWTAAKIGSQEERIAALVQLSNWREDATTPRRIDFQSIGRALDAFDRVSGATAQDDAERSAALAVVMAAGAKYLGEADADRLGPHAERVFKIFRPRWMLDGKATRQQAMARFDAVRICCSAGETSDRFIPELTSMLASPDRAIRRAAMCGLEAMGPRGLPALPDLLRIISDPSVGEYRSSLIFAIRPMGPGAAAAIPTLMSLSNDRDELIAGAAATVLKAITAEPGNVNRSP